MIPVRIRGVTHRSLSFFGAVDFMPTNAGSMILPGTVWDVAVPSPAGQAEFAGCWASLLWKRAAMLPKPKLQAADVVATGRGRDFQVACLLGADSTVTDSPFHTGHRGHCVAGALCICPHPLQLE